VRWKIEVERGSAAEMHDRSAESVSDMRPARTVRLLEPGAPALVLGSSQTEGIVDLGAARAAGVSVVRRRSGGGAVFVAAHHVVWVDLVVPRSDPLWDDDVGAASWWVGDCWAAALGSLGVSDPVTVWKDAMVRTEWSSLVCFAGLGAGEVLVGGAKAVGVSQRRTRSAALFQTALLLCWEPRRVLELLTLGGDQRERAAGELEHAAVGVGNHETQVVFDAVVAALPA